MHATKEQLDELRGLIHKHFDFLVESHGFSVSSFNTGRPKNESCSLEYKSSKKPSLHMSIGSYFPDFVVELSVSSPRSSYKSDRYRIEEIKRLIHGIDCRPLLNHSCYRFDLEIFDQVLKEMAELLSQFVVYVINNEESVFAQLHINRLEECNTYTIEEHNKSIRSRAQICWEKSEYRGYLDHIRELDGAPNATDQKRIYICKKKLQ